MKFFIILFFVFSIISSPSAEEVKIIWSEEYKLTWSDFKASKTTTSDYVASTSSGISYTYSYTYTDTQTRIITNIIITSNFYPYKSWYNKKEVSDYILKHEQTHFDISELHARILKKRVAKITFSETTDTELEFLYYKTEKERITMQHRFDGESNHSKNKEKELEWEIYIAQQLKKYERWK